MWRLRLQQFSQCFLPEVRANAETPADARQAKEFGAEGIGLVRTEHMFFEGQRIVAMRQMILATDESDRRQALEKLLVMQREDITESRFPSSTLLPFFFLGSLIKTE